MESNIFRNNFNLIIFLLIFFAMLACKCYKIDSYDVTEVRVFKKG